LKQIKCQAEQRDLKTVAPLSHWLIVLTDTIGLSDYRFLHYRPNPVIDRLIDVDADDFSRAVHEVVVCEGTSMQLTCPEGQMVLVTSAMWGRGDARTCSRGGNGNSQIRRVQFVNVTDNLRQLCDGRTRCHVTADVITLGDPREASRDPPLYVLTNYTCKRI